mmetsp:Transcript_11513/g.32651  ORF Transcript_11513/g.32651 Transcript_11513/m.32651 type:complete len:488 (-) Transcript_11513:38-1501(-)|eukprot:CAMPEP_0117667310 /NCGR_PEP_ID=MMETSP0804-20121206/10886_1 /TAXON_ID=1074897 /ORGANISM="Tetraselmis astigmatica, Strain CCMP880" /LENGTH=487 /DNA_ID=CAMNT_0005475003 /DNA_START=99 /DNA_END=1562 /DNA_ORIENTATION=-
MGPLPGPRWSTKALAASAVITNLVFSGVIFGWAPLKLLLEKDGVYRDLCLHQEHPSLSFTDVHRAPGVTPSFSAGNNSAQSSCAAKEAAFSAIFSVAGVVAQLAGFACGSMTDQLDPRLTVSLGGLLVSVCIYLLGVLDPSPDQLYLLPSVYGALTFGGMILLFSSFSVSFVWQQQQNLLLTAANTAFDASAAMTLILLQLYDTGIPRGTLFTGYAACALVLTAIQVSLWCDNASSLVAAKKHDASDSDAPVDETPAGVREEYADGSAPLLTDHTDTGPSSTGPPQLQLLQHVRRREFVFLVIFASVHILRSVLYLGTNGMLLKSYGDDAKNYLYTRIFSLSLPACVIYIPVIPWTISTYGWRNVFHLINAIGLTWNLLALVPVLPVQVVAGIVYTCFRAYIFSCFIGFCAYTYGPNVSGRLYGVVTFISGFASALQYPAVSWTLTTGGGNFTYLYAAMACAVIPTTLLVFWCFRGVQAVRSNSMDV